MFFENMIFSNPDRVPYKCVYTVSPKTCDHVFDDNLNYNCLFAKKNKFMIFTSP